MKCFHGLFPRSVFSAHDTFHCRDRSNLGYSFADAAKMLMQDIIAPVQSIHFDLDEIVYSQQGALPLPFPNMDKANVGVCEFFLRSNCSNQRCPFRHIHGDKTVVCKHWLRGLCKKGTKTIDFSVVGNATTLRLLFQATIVNFFTNTTWLKCPNVTSSPNSVSA